MKPCGRLAGSHSRCWQHYCCHICHCASTLPDTAVLLSAAAVPAGTKCCPLSTEQSGTATPAARHRVQVQDVSGLLDRLLNFLEPGQGLRHSRDAYPDQGPAAALPPHSRRGHCLRSQHLAAGACCWDTAAKHDSGSVLHAAPRPLTVVHAWLQHVEEPEARAAFIWMLGEHGRDIQVRSPRWAWNRLSRAAKHMLACPCKACRNQLLAD